MAEGTVSGELSVATNSAVQRCRELHGTLEHVGAQLAALQDGPEVTVNTALQKVRDVLQLMNSLASECAEQLESLVHEIGDTAIDIWPEGTEAIEELRKSIDGSADRLAAALPPCEQTLDEAVQEFTAQADGLEQVAQNLSDELDKGMETVDTVVTAALTKVEEAIAEHTNFVDAATENVRETSELLSITVQSSLVDPFDDATRHFTSEIQGLRQSALQVPVQEARDAVAAVVDDIKDSVKSCMSTFDDSVDGFCDELAGRGENVSTKSRASQELTSLVKPIFEDIVQKLPGVKAITDTIGVGL